MLVFEMECNMVSWSKMRGNLSGSQHPLPGSRKLILLVQLRECSSLRFDRSEKTAGRKIFHLWLSICLGSRAAADPAVCVADFHRIRHSFVSMLAAGNAHSKLAQRLARHSDINLNLNCDRNSVLTDADAALKVLPEFSSMFRDGMTRQGFCVTP